VRVVIDTLDSLVLGISALAAVLLIFLLRQTILRRRGASVQCALRLGVGSSTHHWHAGVARYTGEDFEWFRSLSLSYQPQHTFVRRSIEIGARRYPRGAETWAVPHGAAIIDCDVITRQGVHLDVELAMSEAATTGLLAWIESSAPGAHSHPDTRV
jgi:hypothetical protein